MKQTAIISTDPISDMFTRIRNAIAVNKAEVSMPHSKSKETIAKIFAEYGYVASVKSTDDEGRKSLQIVINGENEPAKITEIKRLSRPGRRLYVKASEIPVIKQGRGIVVVSTSQGIMTGHEAKAKKVGGELICQIY